MRILSTNQKGFTISELIVVIVVLGILTGLVMTTLGDYYTANTTSLGKTTQDTDTRSVLHTIESSASDADGFLSSLTVANPTGPTNNNVNLTWSFKGSDPSSVPADQRNRVLITSSTATDLPPTNDSRLPVFLSTGAGSDIDTGQIAKYNYVYFIATDPRNTAIKNLYRRTIVPVQTYYNKSGIAVTPYQKTSCASSVIAANPTICKSTDALLLGNVTNFTIDYYNSPNDANPVSDIYNDTTDMSASVTAAKVAKLSVTTSQRINGKLTTSTANIRISRSY